MSAPPIVLADASIQVILEGQAPTGAYVASPNFSQYGFAWLRDGAYCALAMDAAGERDSAARFHAWVVRVVLGEREQITRVVDAHSRGEAVTLDMMLPTRYTLDGLREATDPSEEWPNFQLDGYGTWLFALAHHLGDAKPDDATRTAVELAASYLAASWKMPCYDYWEEFGNQLHTSTLAAIAAGLRAAGSILDREDLHAKAEAVTSFVRSECVVDGSFVKGPDDARVDASLLSLATPFGVIEVNDPQMRATVERIRSELLSPTGGVRRYVGDTYFGGSPWMLLTSWLGWHLRSSGDDAGYRAARAWVEERAGEGGWMAEQITDEPQNPVFVAQWEDRWGSVANPLLWSHAKYLLMESGARA